MESMGKQIRSQEYRHVWLEAENGDNGREAIFEELIVPHFP